MSPSLISSKLSSRAKRWLTKLLSTSLHRPTNTNTQLLKLLYSTNSLLKNWITKRCFTFFCYETWQNVSSLCWSQSCHPTKTSGTWRSLEANVLRLLRFTSLMSWLFPMDKMPNLCRWAVPNNSKQLNRTKTTLLISAQKTSLKSVWKTAKSKGSLKKAATSSHFHFSWLGFSMNFETKKSRQLSPN